MTEGRRGLPQAKGEPNGSNDLRKGLTLSESSNVINLSLRIGGRAFGGGGTHDPVSIR